MGFQPFRLGEEVFEDAPRSRREVCLVALVSAGRGGDVEGLAKLGSGSESTMLQDGGPLLHFGSPAFEDCFLC